jgi:hypothetical protein
MGAGRVVVKKASIIRSIIGAAFIALVPAGESSAQPVDACFESKNPAYQLSPGSGRPGITVPRAAEIQLPERNSAPGNDNVHVLVQLCDGVTRQEFVDIGIELLSRYQGTTYTATVPLRLAQQLTRSRSLTALSSSADDAERAAARQIRWVGTLPPGLKMATALRTGQLAERGRNADGTLRLRVRFYQDVTRAQAERVLALVTRDSGDFSQVTHLIWHVSLERTKLADLAAEDVVRSIDQAPPRFTPTNDEARAVVAVDDLQSGSTPPVYLGLAGDGIAVAVMDNAVDPDHDDFWTHDELGQRIKFRFEHHSGGQSRAHGTHIAGTIGGNGFQSKRSTTPTLQFPVSVDNNGDPYQWRGMAPLVTLVSFEIGEDDVGKVEDYYEAFAMLDAGLSNHSYVQSCTDYDYVAETIDSVIHGSAVSTDGNPIPARSFISSAGNNGITYVACGAPGPSGYVSILAPAKNAIVVGALKNDAMWPQSSLGPTPDGRLKPDVVAPGCVTSPVFEDEVFPEARANGYLRMCGTSMAAAVVSGISALLLEQWNQSFVLSDCLVDSGCGPLPSTLKAVLIQSATDRIDTSGGYANFDTGGTPVTFYEGPDYVSGYGSVNALAARNIIAAGPGSDRLLHEAEIASTTEVDTYYMQVPADAAGIRVTLAWDDEPGNPDQWEILAKLINDLDLVLISPSEQQFGPWVLPIVTPALACPSCDHDPTANETINPAELRAERVNDAGEPLVDRRNNVEQVEIPGPDIAPGVWTIRVTTSTAPDGPQTYSIAANHPLSLLQPRQPNPPELDVAGDRPPHCIEIDWAPRANGFSFDLPGATKCGFVPVEPLCRYGRGCSLCDALGRCPGIGWKLTGLPETGFRIEIRNSKNEAVAVDRVNGHVRTLSWTPEQPESYGIFFLPSDKTIPKGKYTVGLEQTKKETKARHAEPWRR